MTVYTDYLNIPQLGDNVATPYTVENEDKIITDAAFGGVLTITPDVASYTHTLESTGDVPQEVHYAVLVVVDGSATGTITIELPSTAYQKSYIVKNDSSYDVDIGYATGNTTTVESGAIIYVFCDGTDCWKPLDKESGGMTTITPDVASYTHTLTSSGSYPHEVHSDALKVVDGSATGDITVTVPDTSIKQYIINNTSAQNVLIGYSTGTAATIATTVKTSVYCDGTDCWVIA